jgi:hypothetical protein
MLIITRKQKFRKTSKPFILGLARTTMASVNSSVDETGSTLSTSTDTPSPQTTIFECDYDKNPTELYQAIEKKEWDKAMDVCQSKDAEEQASTWVARKESSGKLRWRLLPLHAAIIFKSPIKLVELLLADNPVGAQSKDDQGMLPLHLAFRNESSWEVIEEVMTAYPQAIFVSDRKGRTPLACGNNSLSSGASLSSSHYPDPNKGFRSICSVLDLYAQIASSEIKQKSQEESRSMMEATISQLQDSQLDKIRALKKEFREEHKNNEHKIQKLNEQNVELKDVVQSQELDISVAQATEKQLTDKLREMTIALKQSNETIKARQEDRKLDDTNLILKNMLESMLIQQQHYERQFIDLIQKYETLLEERQTIQSIFIEASEQQSIHEERVLDDAKAFLSDQQKKLSENILGMLEEKKIEDQ